MPADRPSLLKSHSDLIAALANLRPRSIQAKSPEAGDFADLRDHLVDIAGAVDAYVLAVGHELAANAGCKVDLSLFTNQLFKAIDGDATFEMDRVAKVRAEEYREFSAGRRRFARAHDMGRD